MAKNNPKTEENPALEKRQWVRIAQRCNNRCLFCLDAENQNGDLVSEEEIFSVLKKGRKEGAKRAVISGGEPTLHPKIFEIIRGAKKMGYRHVQIISNGRMLAYGNFAKKLKEAGLDEVTLSLHSHLKKDFEEMTQAKGSYAQALKGLSNALKLGFIVSVDIVINKINYRKLEDTLKFYIQLGVFEFDLLWLIPFGSAWKNWKRLSIPPAEAKKYLSGAFSLSSDRRLHIWTNRLPARFLEGFEQLIQNPAKLKDEVAAREIQLQEFIQKGKPLSCAGKRCEFCFLKDFCFDLSELKKKGVLETKAGGFCLEGRNLKIEKFKFSQGMDIFRFLDFFIQKRYFAKGEKCERCARKKECAGVWIETARERGFRIAKPEAARAFVLHLDRCNQNCLFCMKKESIAKRILFSKKEVLEKIERAKKDGYSRVDFFGGEPTVFPFFKEAVRRALEFGMGATLATNSILFSSEKFAGKFFSGMEKEKISIRTSFHSYRPEIHDRITRVKGSHGKTVAGIKNMQKYTDKILANVVITALNFRDLSSIVGYLWKMGVKEIKFAGLNFQGELKKNKWLIVPEEKYGKELAKALKLAKKLGFRLIQVEKMTAGFLKKSGIGKMKGVKAIDLKD